MRSELVKEAEKTVDDCREKIAKFDQVESDALQEKAEAEDRLQELEAELSRMLADVALGRMAEKWLFGMKKVMADLKELIKDTPLIIEGLKAKKKHELSKWRKVKQPLQKLEKDKNIKAETVH